MRTHEEFVNEVYTRKEKYIKQKRNRRKNIITAAVPFAVLAVLYSVMVLPAMMPAGDDDPNYKEPTTQTGYSDSAETTQNEENKNTTPLVTKQPSNYTTKIYHETVTQPSLHTQSQTQAPGSTKPPQMKPDITVSIDKVEYSADEKILVTITDTANAGFGYSKTAQLFIATGDSWEFIPNFATKPAVAYRVVVVEGKEKAVAEFKIDLSEYENLKADSEYKLVFRIEGEDYEAYFTLK